MEGVLFGDSDAYALDYSEFDELYDTYDDEDEFYYGDYDDEFDDYFGDYDDEYFDDEYYDEEYFDEFDEFGEFEDEEYYAEGIDEETGGYGRGEYDPDADLDEVSILGDIDLDDEEGLEDLAIFNDDSPAKLNPQ